MIRNGRVLRGREKSHPRAGITILVLGGVIVGGLLLGLAVRPLLRTRNVEASRPVENAVVVPGLQAAVDASGGGVLAKRVNDIDVSVRDVRFGSSQVLIDTCFEMPDNSDWAIYEATLQQSGKPLAYVGSMPIEVVEMPSNGSQRVTTWGKDRSRHVTTRAVGPTSAAKGHRCDTLSFDGFDRAHESQSIKFSVATILAYPSEGGVCDTSYLAKVQRALDTRKTGIRVGCALQSLGSGGGSSGLDILAKPASMSPEEAQALVSGNDLFVDVNGIRGPWVFELPVK